MKLMYSLPPADLAAFEASAPPDEKILYAVPFEILENRFVSGYTVVTDRRLLTLLDGTVLYETELARCTDFSTEVLYGNSEFLAVVDGTTVPVCRFLSGRHLARYSVISFACLELAERARKRADPGEPVVNDEKERFCPDCGRPFIRGTTICPFCRNSKEVYRKLWGLTKGLRLLLLFPFFASMITLILQFALPAVQRVAVNDYLTNEAIQPVGSLSDPNLRGFLAVFAAMLVLEFLPRVIWIVQTWLSQKCANRLMLLVRTLLFEKIAMLSISSISRQSTGDLIDRIMTDVEQAQSYLTGSMPSLLTQIVSFTLALVLLLVLNPLMSLFVFIPLPLVIWLISRFWKTMQIRNRKKWVLGKRVSNYLMDVISGVRVVKAFGNEEREIRTFNGHTDRASNYSISTLLLFDTVFPLLGFLIRVGSYLILFYGNYMLFSGSMSYGELHQFNCYVSIIYGPLMTITSLPRATSAFLTSAGKILEVLEEVPEINDIAKPVDLRLKGDVRVNDVTFGYDTYHPVLRNITFEAKPGEMIGIVGLSGSGKTTLVNLIMRLYDVTYGSIEIDGVNVKDISQKSLRSQIGVVLQETHLFAGSIRDNIRYSKPSVTDEEVIAAARLANAHDFIVNLPEGYNTIVGEKGYTLSGGERQRIAIARALIHDPQILILDEATAALDTETERMIQDGLNRLSKNRTTFAIAHRLSTLRNADRLIVLDQGHLVECGTHQELLALKGQYWRLVMAQRQGAGMLKRANQLISERQNAETGTAAAQT